MTKKLLLKWLEAQRCKALSVARSKHAEEVKAFEDALYIAVGLEDFATEVFTKLNEVDTLAENWRKKFAPYIGVNRGYYGSLHTTLYPFISSQTAAYDRLRQQEFDRNAPKRTAMEAAFDEAHSLIDKNYSNVLLNVSRLKDAKLGMDYLKALGFDLSELVAMDTAPVETALALPIDRRYLFIGGAKRED